MASTITNLINTINPAFPVAGQDNSSQGFRDNFNIIQQSLLATQGQIDTINNAINTPGSEQSTAVHIYALQDLTIGSTNAVTLSNNGHGGILANTTNTSVQLIGVASTVQTTVSSTATTSVTTSTATVFAVASVAGILKGATVTFNAITYTVTNINNSTNFITVNPPFHDGDISQGQTLTFYNPFTPPTGNLYLNGDINVTGNVTAYAGLPSDERLKENITTITNALSMVNSMRGVFYDWTDNYLATINHNPLFPKHDTGVIAQEIESVLPEVVISKPNGSLTVKYEKIVGVLIESIKEMSVKIDSLQAKVNSLTTSTNV
jgi:hypothetical protein